MEMRDLSSGSVCPVELVMVNQRPMMDEHVVLRLKKKNDTLMMVMMLMMMMMMTMMILLGIQGYSILLTYFDNKTSQEDDQCTKMVA